MLCQSFNREAQCSENMMSNCVKDNNACIYNNHPLALVSPEACKVIKLVTHIVCRFRSMNSYSESCILVSPSCNQCQQTVQSTLYRSCKELNRIRVLRRLSLVDRLEQIRKWVRWARGVQPVSYRIHEESSRCRLAGSSSPQLPVWFGPVVSVIKWDTPHLADGWVVIALHLVDTVRNDGQVQ